MRHFDAWILRDPYSICHYYSTGRRWQESVRDMIHDRRICAPQIDSVNTDRQIVDPWAGDMSAQADCQFLQKLPPEIRLIIYRYVFGDEAVHLVQLKGKIRHVRCQNPASSIVSHRSCCPITPARWRAKDGRLAGHSDAMLYPHTHSNLPTMLSNSSLSLLRTCRAIYLEAADIPYSELVFDVDDLYTFVAFSLNVCPERLRSIKRLTVQWTPIWQPMTGEGSTSSIYSHTHNDNLWALFWSRVQALTGLEELQISLDLGRLGGAAEESVLIGGKRMRLASDEAWVAPMLSVRGLKSFDLGITARCDTAAKAVVDEICRDAVQLRDKLREAMCSPRELPHEVTGPVSNLTCAIDNLKLLCQPRLAITAA
jgi:hypothetical protein